MIRSANKEIKRNIHILVYTVSTHAAPNCANRNFFCYAFRLYLSIAEWHERRIAVRGTVHVEVSKNLAKMFQLGLLYATQLRQFYSEAVAFSIHFGIPL